MAAQQLRTCVPEHLCFSGSLKAQRARSVRAHRHSTACCSRPPPGVALASEKHQLQTSEQQNSISRRQWLLASAVAAQLAGIPLPAAAAPGICQLQTSSATGLKWCDIAVGEGALPIKGAFTKAHYTAKLGSTGAVFDSTYQRKAPLIFKVGEHELIEAFDVAMLGAEDIPPMHEGGKRLVVAPPGPMQRQGTKSLLWVVGLSEALEEAGELSPERAPTSDLVFEIELLAKRRR